MISSSRPVGRAHHLRFAPCKGNGFALPLALMATLLEAELLLPLKIRSRFPANIRKVLRLQGGKSRVKFQVFPPGGFWFSLGGARQEARRFGAAAFPEAAGKI